MPETKVQRARRLAREWVASLDFQGNSAWRNWQKHVYVTGYMAALKDVAEGEVGGPVACDVQHQPGDGECIGCYLDVCHDMEARSAEQENRREAR